MAVRIFTKSKNSVTHNENILGYSKGSIGLDYASQDAMNVLWG